MQTTRKRNNILDLIVLLTLLSQIFPSSNFAQPFAHLRFPPSAEEKKILEIQDTRAFDKNKIILDYLKSNKYNRDRGILVFLNLDDTNLFEKVRDIYLESPPEQQEILAMLFSSFNTSACEKFLLNDLTKTVSMGIPIFHQYSLSRIGSEESLRYMMNSATDDMQKLGAFIHSLPYFSVRKIGNEEAFKKAAEILKIYPHDDYQYSFAYSLNRFGNKDIIAKYVSELTSLTELEKYETRMWSFSALGKLLDTANIELMLSALEKETDWRVKVNIAATLGNKLPDLNSPLTDKLTGVLLKHAVEDPSAHVSIVAWQSLGKLFAGADTRNPLTRKIQQDVRFVLTPTNAILWQIKAEAIRAYAKIFKDEVKDELLTMFSVSSDYDLKAAIVGSFAFMGDGLVYKELRDSISADVMRYNAINPNKDGSMIGSDDLAKIYRAFVEALAELDNKLDTENKNIIRLIFSEFSTSKNNAITDVCLTNLQDSMYLQYRGETCQIMKFDYAAFKYPADKEVMLMYISAWGGMKCEGAKELLEKNLKHSDYDIAKASADALKNITGIDYEKQITAPKYKTDFDWKFIDKLNDKKIATIKTSQGDIKIELYPDIAPFTVQSFVKLGEKGFYDNTIFHRVVPNFVIQGGDPTGTGYGGPGYSIRSEFSPISYFAYYVGMASSGKDTEGSQFFITHSPQPHLDGRYTIFGWVKEGYDVVDKIQIGDKIESISFSNK